MRRHQHLDLEGARKLAWLHSWCGDLKNQYLDEVYDLAQYHWEQRQPGLLLQSSLQIDQQAVQR